MIMRHHCLYHGEPAIVLGFSKNNRNDCDVPPIIGYKIGVE